MDRESRVQGEGFEDRDQGVRPLHHRGRYAHEHNRRQPGGHEPEYMKNSFTISLASLETGSDRHLLSSRRGSECAIHRDIESRQRDV